MIIKKVNKSQLQNGLKALQDKIIYLVLEEKKIILKDTNINVEIQTK